MRWDDQRGTSRKTPFSSVPSFLLPCDAKRTPGGRRAAVTQNSSSRIFLILEEHPFSTSLATLRETKCRKSEERGQTKDGRKVYSLDDVYSCADLITYPSTIEGFGNAFLEAVYHRKPILVNNYAIYDSDIRPKGFRTIEMEDYITSDSISRAREVLTNGDLANEMAEVNYELAKRFFSYEVLEQKLTTLLMNCFGSD
jgi:hypothetical protein